MKEKYINYLDYLKVLACFCVIVTHTNAYIEVESSVLIYTVLKKILIILYKTAVPLFIMISGTLNLGNKNLKIKEFYKKRISRVLIPLLVITTLSFITNNNFSLMNLKSLLSHLLQGDYLFHLWYLYLIIGLYLLTPYLNKIVLNSSTKELLLLLTISLFFVSFIPSINILIAPSLINQFFNIYMLYYLLGYTLNKIDISKKQLILLIISIITTISIYIFVSSSDISIFKEIDTSNTIIVLMSILLFITFKYIFKKQNKVITTISKTTFGIYLIHYILMPRLEFLITTYEIHFLIYDMAVMLICFVIIYILKKIPIIKKYI